MTAAAQQPLDPLALTLAEARAAARRVSPELRGARAAVDAAEARARQAGAFPNPTLAYSHERTSRDGATNAQHIAALEQPLDVLGQRAARKDAAVLRVALARARVDAAQAQLDFDVARAFANALAAERRATLARRAADAFAEAQRVSRVRLTAGDVSGYADRRLQLEAARYAVLAAQTALTRDSARLALAVLIVNSSSAYTGPMLAAAIVSLDARALDSAVANAGTITVPAGAQLMAAAESLQATAIEQRAELRAARLERDAAAAEIRLAERGRVPVPVVSAGIKTERTAGADGFRGLVAGVSLPLPIWDRSAGAIAAAEADTRRRESELDVLRRQIAREVAEAFAARLAIDAQLQALGPRVGLNTEIAMRAARTSYAEGEITLVEWLDAVRAYQEAEAAFAALQAESLIRRAALERAVGVPLFED